MVESLIGMGMCFFWGLLFLLLVLVAYAIIKSPLSATTPFMAIVGDMLPIGTFIIVAAAIGAFFGSWFDAILGADQLFATAGIVGGSVAGVALWRRRDVSRET